ncbi:hypothetical protein TrRE_jg8474 [Triparma retinervis]|uniref:RanBP2-type domain-containing protein n=1 Tax=Triparma retinervis TaxID=2557542 RepID=A0A9W7DSQ1_9STRA|nr:hypothetical protein TrRE_jg8474 [Triparma retinervis]
MSLIKYAISKGVGWIDTADSYGAGSDKGEEGYAETLIGEALLSVGLGGQDDQGSGGGSTNEGMARRTRIGTKAGMRLDSEDKWTARKLTKDNLKEVLEKQRERLGVKAIDLWSFHHMDTYTDAELDGLLRVLGSCQDSGLVLNVGLCNCTVSQVSLAMRYVQVAAVQNRWKGKRGMIHFCRENDIAFFPYGCLGGVRKRNGKEDSDIRQFPKICSQASLKGVSPEVLLLAYYRQKFPQTICLIVGCRSTSRIDDLMSVSEVLFTEMDILEIDSCGPQAANREGKGGRRNGDWECPQCRANNFKSRTECFKSNCYGKRGMGEFSE